VRGVTLAQHRASVAKARCSGAAEERRRLHAIEEWAGMARRCGAPEADVARHVERLTASGASEEEIRCVVLDLTAQAAGRRPLPLSDVCERRFPARAVGFPPVGRTS
jgi:hypothetical protein